MSRAKFEIRNSKEIRRKSEKVEGRTAHEEGERACEIRGEKLLKQLLVPSERPHPAEAGC
jgi:hypothetical protein